AAGYNLEMLAQEAAEFFPKVVSCQGPEDVSISKLPAQCRMVSQEEVASHPEVDMVVAASVGKAGLRPIMAALEAGKPVVLANKEPVVMAGEIVMAQARRNGTDILPVDSEPSAIWQCLRGEDKEVSRVIITASGGPFRKRSPKDLSTVTPNEALRHPTWSMGRKISIDSATLMNKGFEVIEAHWLFDLPWEKIDVVVHPQSIIHAMVEFADGSVKAQLSPPDMRLPIQYALFYPQRVKNSALPSFSPVETGALTFEELDVSRYPCFQIALEAGRKGLTYPAVLSAADEVAVELFLAGAIAFTDIPNLVEWVLSKHEPTSASDLEGILEVDDWARKMAYTWAK
ncbi:1-deoxy-D-xylulose-5-phosphate reductoisomerase, partial [SAR202 cluster bacterium AC-647-N09_OGT_505m]|nr:1-deoxy-D-xylulose-5-phosphate reductoisomerase [SAR202 cluster bacterium AC-647-N09_OGT_505m]